MKKFYATAALAFVWALVIGMFAPMLISADSWEAVILGIFLMVGMFLLTHWFVVKVILVVKPNTTEKEL